MSSSYPQPTAVVQDLFNRSSEYILRSYPVRDYPINIRPGIIFITGGWVLLLGVLGMAPIPALPINDKALHFFGLGFATFLIYFIIDVPEGPGRRIWYIRRSPLLLTLFLSFFIGSILSEFFQSLLPWKEFQIGDIAANLLGSTLFLYLAHLLNRRIRRRLELSTFYQPLSHQSSTTYRDAQGRQHTFDPSTVPPRSTGSMLIHDRRQSTIWEEDSEGGESEVGQGVRGGGETRGDQGEEGTTIFGIGDEDDEDDRKTRARS